MLNHKNPTPSVLGLTRWRVFFTIVYCAISSGQCVENMPIYMVDHCRDLTNLVQGSKSVYIDTYKTVYLTYRYNKPLYCTATFLASDQRMRLLLYFEKLYIDWSAQVDRLHIYDGASPVFESRLTPERGLYGKYDRKTGSSGITSPSIHDYWSSRTSLTLSYDGTPTYDFNGFHIILTAFRDVYIDGTCDTGFFKCTKNKICIEESMRCNRIANCGTGDLSDERNCSSSYKLSNHTTLVVALVISLMLLFVVFVIGVACWTHKSGLRDPYAPQQSSGRPWDRLAEAIARIRQCRQRDSSAQTYENHHVTDLGPVPGYAADPPVLRDEPPPPYAENPEDTISCHIEDRPPPYLSREVLQQSDGTGTGSQASSNGNIHITIGISVSMDTRGSESNGGRVRSASARTTPVTTPALGRGIVHTGRGNQRKRLGSTSSAQPTLSLTPKPEPEQIISDSTSLPSLAGQRGANTPVPIQVAKDGDMGTDPDANPGVDPGTNPGANPDTNPGAKPGTNLGANPGTDEDCPLEPASINPAEPRVPDPKPSSREQSHHPTASESNKPPLGKSPSGGLNNKWRSVPSLFRYENQPSGCDSSQRSRSPPDNSMGNIGNRMYAPGEGDVTQRAPYQGTDYRRHSYAGRNYSSQLQLCNPVDMMTGSPAKQEGRSDIASQGRSHSQSSLLRNGGEAFRNGATASENTLPSSGLSGNKGNNSSKSVEQTSQVEKQKENLEGPF